MATQTEADRLRIAIERMVASLESKGQWKVANALSIGRAALAASIPEREKTIETGAETGSTFPNGKVSA